MFNWFKVKIKKNTVLYQKLRNIRMYLIHKKLGLSKVDRTFYIHTPVFHISSDLKTGKFGLIGYNCYICPNVEFGNYVLIAPELNILGGDHSINEPGVPMIFSSRPKLPKTIIEDDVWIGRRVIINAGVRIGTGSVVAAGSIVTKDVKPYTVVGGVPAKFIKMRFNIEEDLNKHENFLIQSPKITKSYPGIKIIKDD